MTLKAPFPAFGGKSKVAGLVWERLGDVANFVEPFCFSAAVLLLRPTEPKVETINDLNAYVSNFWRAVQADPEAVAAHAGWTVEEWKATGGYGNQSGKVNENAARERIWFSPHCIQPEPDPQLTMWDEPNER